MTPRAGKIWAEFVFYAACPQKHDIRGPLQKHEVVRADERHGFFLGPNRASIFETPVSRPDAAPIVYDLFSYRPEDRV